MKNSIYIFVVSLVFVTKVFYSQAIYKNASDFLAGKTTHAGKHTRIKLYQLFKKNSIEVKCADTVFLYYKKDVFGYVDKDKLVYRFYKNEIYPILNPNENILIYKVMNGTGMKNSPIVEFFFFSKEASSEILPLTLRQLEAAFEGNPDFNKTIEIYFKKDSELLEYDNIHKIYKINRLLNLESL